MLCIGIKLRQLPPKINGFGMVEVLISAVILAVGLIGLASLQTRSIRAIQEGDNLVTASMIAQETAKRMLTNKYITSLGRSGYLALDLSGNLPVPADIPTWATDTLAANSAIVNCYPPNDDENVISCYNNGATIGNSSDHIQALENMALLDQVELRMLAANSLPNGEIMICFDSSSTLNNWECDNVATRIASRGENIFTVKVRWNNIFSNTQQIYTLQFTAQCPNGSGTFCG